MVQLHAAVVQVHAVDQLVVLLVILVARESGLAGRALEINSIESHYGKLRLWHLPLPNHSADRDDGNDRPSQG